MSPCGKLVEVVYGDDILLGGARSLVDAVRKSPRKRFETPYRMTTDVKGPVDRGMDSNLTPSTRRKSLRNWFWREPHLQTLYDCESGGEDGQ